MRLLVKRDEFSDVATIGKLYIDGEYFCETLEDKDRFLEAGGKKEYSKTAIPRGVYSVVLNESTRFKKLMPLLLNVPQFEGIRIHSGNKPEDTDGCILVGRTRRSNFIENSRDAFNDLMAILEKAIASGEKIEIEVV